MSADAQLAPVLLDEYRDGSHIARASMHAARTFMRSIVHDPDYQDGFRRRMISGRMHPTVETMAWHYAEGKPPDRIEHGGVGDFHRYADLPHEHLIRRAEVVLEAVKHVLKDSPTASAETISAANDLANRVLSIEEKKTAR